MADYQIKCQDEDQTEEKAKHNDHISQCRTKTSKSSSVALLTSYIKVLSSTESSRVNPHATEQILRLKKFLGKAEGTALVL